MLSLVYDQLKSSTQLGAMELVRGSLAVARSFPPGGGIALGWELCESSSTIPVWYRID